MAIIVFIDLQANIHMPTKRTYITIAGLLAWFIFTVFAAYAAVMYGFGLKQYQCEVSQFEQPSAYRQPKHDKNIIRLMKHYKLPKDEAYEIVNVVNAYTKHEPFPSPELVLAIMATESGFDRNARSTSSTAKGLMQVINAHTRKHDIWSNIEAGVKVLREYHKITGSSDGAIAAYNMGPAPVLKGNKNMGYVNKVKKHMKIFLDQNIENT